MRRTLIATVLLAVLALLGPASSAQTADEGGQGESATLNITKVVDGEGPTGGYVIEFFCDIQDDRAEGAGFGGSLAFDAAGPGAPETQVVDVPGPGICSVTETDANGADSTTYACEFVPGDVPDSPPFEGTEGAGGCVDDQSADFASPADVGTITVTNTFEADVIDEEEEPPAVDDDVVDATPPFTG